MVTTILEAQCRSRRWGATGGGVPLLGARSGRGLRETTVGWWMSRRSQCIGMGTGGVRGGLSPSIAALGVNHDDVR